MEIDIPPVSHNIKIDEKEEEDCKLPVVENPGEANSFFQAEWDYRIIH